MGCTSVEGRTKAFNQAHEKQQKFDQEEEERMVQWVKELDEMGVPPRGHHVEEMRGILMRRGLQRILPNKRWESTSSNVL